jgi:hypothetical protein
MVAEFVGLLGATPDKVEGNELTFLRGDLRTTLSIWKSRWDRTLFDWLVVTSDPALHDRMDGHGGMSVQIDHPVPSAPPNPPQHTPPPGYPWPVDGSPLASEVAAAVTAYTRPSLDFVRDRHDLGMLLLADDDVHRAGVWYSATVGSPAARLTAAILLARHYGDRELERAAVATLRERGEDVLPRTDDRLFREEVAYWAAMYATSSGVDLGDLRKLTWKQPRYPD